MPARDWDRISGSFRDPSGFLFRENGQLYRQVNQAYRADYDLLISSGLYERLVGQAMLIPHREVDVQPVAPAIAYKVIQPEKVAFISYPYEWAFSQLKDAALLTLAIQREALEKGMTLKDASAYNIQFHQGHPVLIDTLSFAAYQPGKPWIAYRQFCMFFLAPLALMAHTDINLGKLSQLYIGGIPLDLASKLLPWPTRLNFGLLSHIHLHAYSQARATGSSSSAAQQRSAAISKQGLLGILDNLEATIKGLTLKKLETQWAAYYSGTNYDDDAFKRKKQIVSSLIDDVAPRCVWDVGANTGVFSRLALSREDCLVISSDIDPGAVEINYRESRQRKERNLLPLMIDLTNPSPAIGWANEERHSFAQRGPADLVIALALIHHLAISNNVPLGDVAKWMATLGKHLVIEFVPKEDSQAQILLATRDDIFTQYTEEGFVEAFSQSYRLLKRVPIEGTLRTLFLFEALA